MNWLKKTLREILIYWVAITPMVLFLDWVLDVRLFADYGILKTTGFYVCIVFYSHVARRAENR